MYKVLSLWVLALPCYIAHFICLYNNVLPGGLFVDEIKMLLHDLSWIPIFVQSLISISYLVFEIRLSKLNNNNNNNKKKKKIEKWINEVPIMRFKLFLGYMLFVTIQINLMCQKLK